MTIEFDINTKRLEEKTDRLLDIPKQMERAVSGAMNTALERKGKAAAWREVKDEFNVRKLDILGKDHVDVFKASPGRLDARMVIHGASNISLGHFLRPKNGPKRRPKVGPTVLVKRSAGRKPVKGAFVKVNPGGAVVFKREGTARLPIAKMFTSAPIRHLEKDDVQDRIYRDIEEGFFQEFERYADHLMSKAGL